MPVAWPTAGELMTPRPITVAHDAPLSRAIGLMRSHSIHELPVLHRNRLTGMITFESVVRRSNVPLITKVAHLMLLPPVVTPTTTFAELTEQLLAAGLRAAPVVGKKGELVGVVSRTDLVRAMSTIPSLARHTVDEVMGPVGMTVRESDPVGPLVAQSRILEEHPVPVIDRRSRLVGAVGIADLGQVLWRPIAPGKRDAERRGSVLEVEVGTVMHSPATTVASGATVGEAARRMTQEKVSSTFVVEEGRPVGIVGQADLLGLAVGGEGTRTNVGDVYVQITGLRGSSDPAIVTEVDRAIAKGLRHIGRHARPILLSLNVSPHATHRSGDATVQARLHTDRGIYYASQTAWNFFVGVADVMEELAGQARRAAEEQRRRRRRAGRVPPSELSSPEDRELEEKIRTATGPDEGER